MSITLTKEECVALHELIDQLSGGSPENIFAWDGTDCADDVTQRACAKVFRAAGEEIPVELERV